MSNIYKYELELKKVQTVKCRAVNILDIQIRNGRPVMWAVTKHNAKEISVGIVMQGTGTDVLAIVDELKHVSTTQCGDLVWHWFTDFGYDYVSEGEEPEEEIEIPN